MVYWEGAGSSNSSSRPIGSDESGRSTDHAGPNKATHRPAQTTNKATHQYCTVLHEDHEKIPNLVERTYLCGGTAHQCTHYYYSPMHLFIIHPPSPIYLLLHPFISHPTSPLHHFTPAPLRPVARSPICPLRLFTSSPHEYQICDRTYCTGDRNQAISSRRYGLTMCPRPSVRDSLYSTSTNLVTHHLTPPVSPASVSSFERTRLRRNREIGRTMAEIIGVAAAALQCSMFVGSKTKPVRIASCSDNATCANCVQKRY